MSEHGQSKGAAAPAHARKERRWMRIYPAALGPEERRAVLGQLFFEGPELRPYLHRYATLIALSVAIATFGMTADSTAVVIGAMLVAPLMTPILAFSAAT